MTEEKPETPTKIGKPGRPVRAMAFAGGGFDTVFQIGVIHALLVSRGRAPDVVAGVSQGAINAVALAEVLQAGENASADSRKSWSADRRKTKLAARVARFRQIFEATRESYDELNAALSPDTYQIDAKKALESLKLPVHSKAERGRRSGTLKKRTGFVNLYNELFGLRVSVGTITRFVRRILGCSAAKEVRPRAARWLKKGSEYVRIWILLGNSLPWLAPVLPTLLEVLYTKKSEGDIGTSAGRILFRSRTLTILAGCLRYFMSLTALFVIWLFPTAVLFFLIWLIGIGAVFASGSPYWSSFKTELLFSAPVFLLTGFLLTSLTYGLAVLLVRLYQRKFQQDSESSSNVWRISFGHCWRAIRDALFTCLNLVSLFIAWTAGLALASAIVHFTWLGAVLLGDICLPERLDFVVANLDRPVGLWIVAAAVVAAIVLILARLKSAPMRLLLHNGVADSLFDQHPVRQLLIRAFDPAYYGDVDLDQAVERGLCDDQSPENRQQTKKQLDSYIAPDRDPQIEVKIGVADVSTGDLHVLQGDTAVVDGLLAAAAVTPIFPPEILTIKQRDDDTTKDTVCVDGANIANEPTRPLLAHLRSRLNEEASAVHLYSVSGLPFSRRQLEQDESDDKGKEYSSLVSVVSRALKLEQFRDAMLERKLIELYSRTMPADSKAIYKAGKDYIKAWVYPVEPEEPLSLTSKLLLAPTANDRRRLISETVADGCRASLERMIQPAIGRVLESTEKTTPADADPTSEQPTREKQQHVSCRLAIANHLEHMSIARGEDLGRLDLDPLPGSDIKGRFGPGLPEVCRHCAINRGISDGAQIPETEEHPSSSLPNTAEASPQRLVEYSLVDREPSDWPEWPAEDYDPEEQPRRASKWVGEFQERSTNQLRTWRGLRYGKDVPKDAKWPEDRKLGGEVRTGRDRPLISFLFSGGVFRGVFQMGVLNALSELNLKPDIIAGASVGSLTAAMVASAFSESHQLDRRAKIARLSATYLAIDRLVLTDRFADFIRTLTVRSGQTKFSLRDVDRVFRIYDSAGSDQFDKEARKVVAGIERLLYISPFELKDLIEAARRQEYHKVLDYAAKYSQEFLDRGGVRDQVLGAEPLALLVIEHVLSDLNSSGKYSNVADIPLDEFLHRSGIYFLATATNLSRGRLEVLGEIPALEDEARPTMLNGLLASSAFPGVFRPRWSWEVTPGTGYPDQLIDGGVMDNLPLDAVAQFLFFSSGADLVERRPKVDGRPVPHLLLAASLEPELSPLDDTEAEKLMNDWPSLWKRTKQLSYNQKLKVYANAQKAIRAIANQRLKKEEDTSTWGWVPMDLEVVTVTPRWLCNTFAFHPMLGFRRQRQAESIAHGCASTLLQLADLASKPENEDWIPGWGINIEDLPGIAPTEDADPFVSCRQVNPPSGDCWYRSGKQCPFTMTKLDDLDLGSTTTRELNRIYQACGRLNTHKAETPSSR